MRDVGSVDRGGTRRTGFALRPPARLAVQRDADTTGFVTLERAYVANAIASRAQSERSRHRMALHVSGGSIGVAAAGGVLHESEDWHREPAIFCAGKLPS
jgi:hypothetical protein